MTITGLDLKSPSWAGLRGGYRIPYDPRPALRILEQGEASERAWKELWEELFHQGDVGEASYAAVPHLVRIHEARSVPEENTYSLVATIEGARQQGTNPPIPTNLKDAYHAGLSRLFHIGLREIERAKEPLLISSIIAVIAAAKGQFALARFAGRFDESERKEILTEAGRE
jgi:hypothetical protein